LDLANPDKDLMSILCTEVSPLINKDRNSTEVISRQLFKKDGIKAHENMMK
jgi:hypothetical protein